MSKWSRFYEGRVGHGYTEYAAGRYDPFIDVIARQLHPGDRVLELGCGIATITRILASRRRYDQLEPLVHFQACDNDPDQIEFARKNLAGIPHVEAFMHDMRDSFTDQCPTVIHTHGVLEHFDDWTLDRYMELQRLSGCRIAIHYVPSHKYDAPSFGDERLMSLGSWERLTHYTDAFTFNDGYDYCLIWRY